MKVFDWDEKKNISNIKKHGIAFEDASLVFLDPICVEIFDVEHSRAHEDRWKAFGMVNRVLMVSFTERYGTIWIISARRATVTLRVT
ncbi:MAG: BrnT family toxin [Treponema sp.]|jgi:uncharacterized DUF497 family protein|nr:BrnT family toxin [Treponema sp.]